MLRAAALHLSLWCSVASLRQVQPRGPRAAREGVAAQDALVFIEQATLDSRCISAHDDLAGCAPPRVFIWGQLRAPPRKLKVEFVGCGTSVLGKGIVQSVPAPADLVVKGFPFQVVCHFPSLARSRSGTAPADLGSIELVAGLDKERLAVTGPPVEIATNVTDVAHLSSGPPPPSGTVGSCLAIMFGKPMFVSIWIRHQCQLGVDGVHMYTYAEDHGVSKQVKATIRNAPASMGCPVELVEWPHTPWADLTPFGSYVAQDNALSHCVVRNAPRYRWMLISDTDEFLDITPPPASLRAFLSSREQLWDEEPKVQVDAIIVQRDAVSGTPTHPKQCKDKRRVLPKSIVGTGRVVTMNPHNPHWVYDKASMQLVRPVSFEEPSSAMRFAHFAFGLKGCVQQSKFVRGAGVSKGRVRSSEDEEPETCLRDYADRLSGVRAGLGSELLAAWAAGASDALPGAARADPVVLELGAGGDASAHAVVQAAAWLGIGAARRLPQLPKAGSALDGDAGQRFVLRLLGWDDAATWKVSRVHGCYSAVRDVVAGGADGRKLPPLLVALLGDLPSEPSIVDANAAVVVSEHPTVKSMDWQLAHDAVTEWSPENLMLFEQCGRNITQYSQGELSAIHEAHLDVIACIAPHISTIDLFPNATRDDLSVSLTAVLEDPVLMA